jgi:hypothetical protein
VEDRSGRPSSTRAANGQQELVEAGVIAKEREDDWQDAPVDDAAIERRTCQQRVHIVPTLSRTRDPQFRPSP